MPSRPTSGNDIPDWTREQWEAYLQGHQRFTTAEAGGYTNIMWRGQPITFSTAWQTAPIQYVVPPELLTSTPLVTDDDGSFELGD